jgi:glycosyltransferase involved in cell wall biosynthesis
VKKRVMFFFPHNPYPPKAGDHRRCLEMLRGLKESGCEVTLVSSTLCSGTEWERSSIEALEGGWVQNAKIQEAAESHKRLFSLMRKCYRYLIGDLPLNHPFYSLGIKHWFSKTVQELSPEVILMSYAYWDGLLDHQHLKPITRIIDTIDLLTLNEKMRRAVGQCLPGRNRSVDGIDGRALQENFFAELRVATAQDEFKIYDSYDFTIAISAEEADIIGRNTRHTKVVHIPMTCEPHYLENSYSGPALFTASPNPFNTQGYYYFSRKVLPIVRRSLPSFSLQVTGSLDHSVLSGLSDGIEIKGFIPDLTELYQSSRFSVCPVFGGTGQPVKIVEAMSYGLPVIALRAAAKRSPVRHGVNGLIADNAEEFADYVIRLWKNQDLCCELGQNARRTIAEEFSRERLVLDLSRLMESI